MIWCLPFCRLSIKNGFPVIKTAIAIFYYFARSLPGDEKGAWHSSDLLYAFSTLDKNWRPFEAVDYEISNQLAKSFIAFAKNGNPNCNEIPVWKPGTAKVMTFVKTQGRHIGTSHSF